MSAAARFSYTAKATLWPLVSRADWGGAGQFGAPAIFLCDYSANAQTMRDAQGDEFVTRQVIYTERADIKRGDRILLGVSAAADPIAAEALEVRTVARQADTFQRKADDFVIGTI